MPTITVSPAVLRVPPAAPSTESTRKLRIFAIDPSLRRGAGQVTTIEVPYEALPQFRGARLTMGQKPGPFESEGERLLDIDDIRMVIAHGRSPSASDPGFLQQMSYAVCSWTLRRFAFALGREPVFAFDGPLMLFPYAMQEQNAYYDREGKALQFGYFNAACTHCTPANSELVFTAAAQDVVIHEVAHALLDGMRPNLLLPTNPDVLAFHEGFADLVAIFSRFSQGDVLQDAIGRRKGDIDDEALIAIGRQFGQARGGQGPLRTSILDPRPFQSEEASPISYHNTLQPHDRGSLLVSAVFEAFRNVYLRKTERWRSVAATVPTLSEHPTLIEALTSTARRLAGHFLNIIIRAIDYLPPVDIDFGEYLRAMITADADLVPNDEWHYREALIYAFRRYGISVREVLEMSEAALKWRDSAPFNLRLESLQRLATLPILSDLPRSDRIRRRRATVLVRFLQENESNWPALGLSGPNGERPERVTLESVRAIQRIGPDGRLMVNYVAEIVAWTMLEGFGWYPGGSTLIISPDGYIRYLIHKRLGSAGRRQRSRHYLLGFGRCHGPLFAAAQTPEHVSASAARLLTGLHRRCGDGGHS